MQGCGIDGISAPVGTTWKLPFIVFDSHMPAAQASLTKTITLLAPCPSFADVYCPGAAAACGSTPCSLREASAPDPEDIPPPSISVNASLLLPGMELVTDSVHGDTLTVAAPCDRGAALPLPACVSGASTAGEPALPASAGAICAIIVQTGLTLQQPPRVVATRGDCNDEDGAAGRCAGCSPAALAARGCGPSVAPYVFELRATDSRGQSARPLPMHVSLWNVSAVAELAYRLTVPADAARDDAARDHLESMLMGAPPASPLARALLVAYWQGVWQVPACDGIADRVLLHAEVSRVSASSSGGTAVAQMEVTLGLQGEGGEEAAVLCLSQLGLLQGEGGIYEAWELVAREHAAAVTRMVLDSSFVRPGQCDVQTPEETRVAWLAAEIEEARAHAQEALLMLVRAP